MELEVRLLRTSERAAAAGVAARALRDDPLFLYLNGDDPLDRQAAAYNAFRDPASTPPPGGFWRRVFGGGGSATVPPPVVWGAFAGGYVIGGAAAAAPEACFVDLLPAEVRNAPVGEEGEPGSPLRLARVLHELGAHHCDERHWHVGPVGVEPGLQGRGVGAAVMGALCAAMDAEGEIAFLETERPENVVFYRRLGFDVVSESELTGLHTWFMRREPRR